jgi:hypothetical protein
MTPSLAIRRFRPLQFPVTESNFRGCTAHWQLTLTTSSDTDNSGAAVAICLSRRLQ